jgi:hypothetical protein
MNTCQQSRIIQPDLPESKKLKQMQDQTIQQQPLKDFHCIRESNNGKLNYGDIKSVIQKYEAKGFSCVTRRNLRYRIAMLDERNGLLVSEVQRPMSTINTKRKTEADEVSPLTDITTNDCNVDVNNNQSNTVRNNTQKENKQKEKHLQSVKDCTTQVASKLLQEQEAKKSSGRTKLPHHCLKKLIKETEAEYNLVLGTIKPETIRSRLRRNNISGVHKQRTPPLQIIEPLIVQWCIKMAQIGMSLDRHNVIELVNDLIVDTDFEFFY